MKEKNNTKPAQGAKPATNLSKKNITASIGPFVITISKGNRPMIWMSTGIICEILSGIEVSARMPEKMTDEELAAFRDWLTKCPFDLESYDR